MFLKALLEVFRKRSRLSVRQVRGKREWISPEVPETPVSSRVVHVESDQRSCSYVASSWETQSQYEHKQEIRE